MQFFAIYVLLLIWPEKAQPLVTSGYDWLTPTQPSYTADWRRRPTQGYHLTTPSPRWYWMRSRYDWTTPSPRRYWMSSSYDRGTPRPRWQWMRPRYDWTTPSPRKYWMRPTSRYNWQTRNPWWNQMGPTQPSYYTDADLPNPLIKVYRLDGSIGDEVIVSCQHRVSHVSGQSRLQLNVVMRQQNFTLGYPDFRSGTEYFFKIIVSSPAFFTCVSKLPSSTLLSDVYTFSKPLNSQDISLPYTVFATFMGALLLIMIAVVMLVKMWTHKVKLQIIKFSVPEGKDLIV